MSEKMQMVGAKVPEQVYEQIRKIAKNERRSYSNVIRILLEDALKARQAQAQGG